MSDSSAIPELPNALAHLTDSQRVILVDLFAVGRTACKEETGLEGYHIDELQPGQLAGWCAIAEHVEQLLADAREAGVRDGKEAVVKQVEALVFGRRPV